MQSISPETIYRGNSAWEKSLPQITKLTKSPLILGRGIQTNNLRNNIFNDLKNQKLNVNSANLEFDCCYEDISRVKNIISENTFISRMRRAINCVYWEPKSITAIDRLYTI